MNHEADYSCGSSIFIVEWMYLKQISLLLLVVVVLWYWYSTMPSQINHPTWLFWEEMWWR